MSGVSREIDSGEDTVKGLVRLGVCCERTVRIVGITAPPMPLRALPGHAGSSCVGPRHSAVLLLLPVCHQGTAHGGPGGDLHHRQHSYPAQWLPPQEGSEAVMERKPAPEPVLKSYLQLDLVEGTLSELSPVEGLLETSQGVRGSLAP